MQHFGAAVSEDAPKAPFATAKEGELAAEALGVADAAHSAHDEPEDSMPERELLEMSTSATARVEAPRHQVHSNKKKRTSRCMGAVTCSNRFSKTMTASIHRDVNTTTRAHPRSAAMVVRRWRAAYGCLSESGVDATCH